MGAITVEAVGAKAKSGASAALDVSTAARIVLDMTLKAAPTGYPSSARITALIETAPASTGPWRAIVVRRYDMGSGNQRDTLFQSASARAEQEEGPFAWGGALVERVLLPAFDQFIRFRWDGASQYGDADPSFTLGLTGTSVVGT